MKQTIDYIRDFTVINDQGVEVIRKTSAIAVISLVLQRIESEVLKLEKLDNFEDFDNEDESLEDVDALLRRFESDSVIRSVISIIKEERKKLKINDTTESGIIKEN